MNLTDNIKVIYKYLNTYLDTNGYKKNIVMIVGNGIIGDSRVIKSAQSLLSKNFNVILIGTKPLKTEYATFVIDNLPCILINSMEFKGILNADSETHFNVTKIIALRINKILLKSNIGILYTHDFWGLDYGSQVMGMNYRNNQVLWIHDIHEYIDGYEGILPQGRLDYAKEVEKKYIKLPDELIIVNEKIAEKLKLKHSYISNEIILHNAPREQIKSTFQLREEIGLDKEIPLGVYLGRATEPRGLNIIIPTLQAIPSLHMALLSSAHIGYLNTLKDKAKVANVLDRLHIFDYVPDNEVSNAVSSASFAISPLTRYGNTDLAIATKILESIHADLPILVSDATFQKEFIEKYKLGVVFESENIQSCIEATKKIIKLSKNNFKIKSSLKNKFSWENQFYNVILLLEKYLQTGKIRRRGVFHGVGPSAGQPFGLAKALRKEGILSESINIVNNNKLNLKYDILWQTPNIRYTASLIKWTADRFDIIHLHFRPIMNFIKDKQYEAPSFIDFSVFKQARKKIIFNFRGSEIRINKEFKVHNPYAWDEKDDPAYALMDDRMKVELRSRVREMSDLILVPDAELQTYVPEAKILPRVIDIEALPYIGVLNNNKPLIVHAPTRRGAKGTDRVLSAISDLKEKGYQFDFELIENMSQVEVIEKLKMADIVIDQLIIGWYGVLGLEAMTLGKVTVAYIRDDIINSVENLPIYNVHPNNLTKKLVELIENPSLRKEIGKKSRAFVESYHSEEVVAKKLQEYYEDLESNPSYSYSFLNQEVNNTLQRLSVTKKLNSALLNNKNSDKKIIKNTLVKPKVIKQEVKKVSPFYKKIKNITPMSLKKILPKRIKNILKKYL